MNDLHVEIGQFRPVDKGALKAFFSLVIYPMGQKILDCRYFVNGDNRWFAFPQKQVKYENGRKDEYIPLISFVNKGFLETLKDLVLEKLKDAKPMEYDGKKKNMQNSSQEGNLQDDASPLWF